MDNLFNNTNIFGFGIFNPEDSGILTAVTVEYIDSMGNFYVDINGNNYIAVG